MKRYTYIEALTMEEKSILSDGAQVTTNGELIFLNFLNSDRDSNYVVAGVAPGFWSRFWEEAIDVKRNDDG